MIDGINIPEYEVTQFNQKIKDVVESNFTYVRIRGEVSQLKSASSGHIYLTLKDENSVLNATIWSQKKKLFANSARSWNGSYCYWQNIYIR